MPFATAMSNSNYACVLNKVQDCVLEMIHTEDDFCIYGDMQQAHLMHKLQREEGRSAVLRPTFVPPEVKDDAKETGRGTGTGTHEPVKEEDYNVEDNLETDKENTEGVPAETLIPEADLQPLALESLFLGLTTLLKKDWNDDKRKQLRQYDDANTNGNNVEEFNEVRESFFYSRYDETIPACVRCNTLMTMNARTTELMIANSGLQADWFDNEKRKDSYRLRKQAYKRFIKKCFDHLVKENNDGGGHEHRVPICPENGYDLLDRDKIDMAVERHAVVYFIQSFFLAMCAHMTVTFVQHNANVKAKTGLQLHELWRFKGIARVYSSLVMHSLNLIRFRAALHNIQFVQWHIHFAEVMPMFEGREWEEWFFGKSLNALREEIYPYGEHRLPITGSINLCRYMCNAYLDLILPEDNGDPRLIQNIWQVVSSWIKDGKHKPLNPPVAKLSPDAARVFAHPDSLNDLAMAFQQGGATLNIDSWIDCLDDIRGEGDDKQTREAGHVNDGASGEISRQRAKQKANESHSHYTRAKANAALYYGVLSPMHLVLYRMVTAVRYHMHPKIARYLIASLEYAYAHAYDGAVGGDKAGAATARRKAASEPAMPLRFHSKTNSHASHTDAAATDALGSDIHGPGEADPVAPNQDLDVMYGQFLELAYRSKFRFFVKYSHASEEVKELYDLKNVNVYVTDDGSTLNEKIATYVSKKDILEPVQRQGQIDATRDRTVGVLERMAAGRFDSEYFDENIDEYFDENIDE
jgi:hypothetical protein